MKSVSALSLAVVGILALMASTGVSSALASGKICSTSGTHGACNGAHGKEYTGKIHAVLIKTTGSEEKHAVKTSGFVQVTCTDSTLEGEVTSASTGTGFITGMTYSGCTNNINGGPCTMSTTASPTNKWHFTATADAGKTGSGVLDIKNAKTSFTCNILFANRTCRYTASEGATSFFGSDTTTTIEFTEFALVLHPVSDGLCSSTAKFDARYELTTPASLFIT